MQTLSVTITHKLQETGMATKNIYLDNDLIKWVNKERAKQGRSFSNYILMMLRERLEKVAKMSR